MKDIKVLYGIDVDCVAGCIDSLEDYIVNKYLVHFLSDNEKTTFKFYTGDSNEVLKMMENHEVELGIVRYPFNNERYNSVTLTDDKFIMANSFLNCIVVRLVLAFILEYFTGLYGIYFACMTAPLSSVPVGFIYYRSGRWRKTLAADDKSKGGSE